jgi:hypothetical protein
MHLLVLVCLPEPVTTATLPSKLQVCSIADIVIEMMCLVGIGGGVCSDGTVKVFV